MSSKVDGKTPSTFVILGFHPHHSMGTGGWLGSSEFRLSGEQGQSTAWVKYPLHSKHNSGSARRDRKFTPDWPKQRGVVLGWEKL